MEQKHHKIGHKTDIKLDIRQILKKTKMCDLSISFVDQAQCHCFQHDSSCLLKISLLSQFLLNLVIKSFQHAFLSFSWLKVLLRFQSISTL